MQHSAEMRRCLEACDVDGARRLAAHLWPHLPQPKSDGEVLASIHHARTQANSMKMQARAYSHRWLLDNGYPSGLPDWLKPRAERLYPRIVGAVGIALAGSSELAIAVKPHVMGAMCDAVLDCYANGDTDASIVKPRMFEAKARITKQLIGRLANG